MPLPGAAREFHQRAPNAQEIHEKPLPIADWHCPPSLTEIDSQCANSHTSWHGSTAPIDGRWCAPHDARLQNTLLARETPEI